MIERIALGFIALLYLVARLNIGPTSELLLASYGGFIFLGSYYVLTTKVNFFSLAIGLITFFSASYLASYLSIPEISRISFLGNVGLVVFALVFTHYSWQESKQNGNYPIFIYAVPILIILQFIYLMVFFEDMGDPEVAKVYENLDIVLLGTIGTLKLQEYKMSKGERNALTMILIVCFFTAIRVLTKFI